MRIWCQIGGLPFDPAPSLIECRIPPDIATFRLTSDQIRRIGKKVLSPTAWPPGMPTLHQAVIVSGYPGEARRTTWKGNGRPSEISFGYYAGTTPVTHLAADQITCRFDTAEWIDTRRLGLPPLAYEVGGISGAPLLVPDYIGGKWAVWVTGVITEAHTDGAWEEVKAASAEYLLTDGRIQLML